MQQRKDAAQQLVGLYDQAAALTSVVSNLPASLECSDMSFIRLHNSHKGMGWWQQPNGIVLAICSCRLPLIGEFRHFLGVVADYLIHALEIQPAHLEITLNVVLG